MALLQAHVFGKLRLQNGESRVEYFPTRRVEELLGYLLLNQHAHHSREKLVEILWPDKAPSNSRASLSTALWRLRNVFDQLGTPAEAYIKTARDWVCLDPTQPLSLDLVDFQRHLAEAEIVKQRDGREKSLRAAIGLYQGGFCEGIYTEWCLLERERLERCYLRALGQLMADLIQDRDYREAAGIGQEILQRDPLREEVHRATMHCYWKLGRRADGVRQFQECARLLQTELQVLPMPETVSIYRRIIEDGLSELNENGALPTPVQRELELAFSTFQDAADNLTALLAAAEKSRETAAAR